MHRGHRANPVIDLGLTWEIYNNIIFPQFNIDTRIALFFVFPKVLPLHDPIQQYNHHLLLTESVHLT